MTVDKTNNGDESTLEQFNVSQDDADEIHTGTVDFFNDTGGYGFIECESTDEDVFYHMDAIGGKDLEEGTEIAFTVEQAEKGPRLGKLLDRDDE